MASAVLASRNEAYWGERKVYMRKYTTTNNSHLKFIPNPNPNNPNPNPSFDLNPGAQIHDLPSKAQFRRISEPPATSLLSPLANDLSLLNRKAIPLNDRKESSHGGYVTFNLGAYSRRELKGLKKRLLSELDQVRDLSNRIESRDFESRSAYIAPHISSGHGGRETITTARPPPLQINYALDSPGTAASKEKRTPKANQCYPPSEFLIGKNKSASPTSKKVSGSKRSLPVVLGRDSKRPMPEPEPLTDKLVASMMRRCGQILTKLMKHRFGWVFNKPVDVVGLGLHDYHKIVKQPMDLGSVKSKLERKVYLSPLDFASDVRLTFGNAMLYNPKGQDVYYMSEQLLSLFNEMFNPAFRKFENEMEQARHRQWPLAPVPAPSRMAKKPDDAVRTQATHLEPPAAQIPVPMPTPVPAPAPKVNPSLPRSSGKLPKPRAKDKVKRAMSFEEKAKLGMNLVNVPSERMEQLVNIIRKRNPQMAQDGDDIELDIEAVDTETLWELDRFVSNYKKMESKIRRQGLMNQTFAAQQNKSPVTENLDVGQGNKKGETGEEVVDIGEEMPASNFPPVEIDKDATYASSSSRSSSGSSSSSDDDSSSSDSGSSSGSDSDADSVRSPCIASKEASVT